MAQPKIDERELAVGRVYARSLLTLARERGEQRETGEELQQLVELLAASPELERFARNPLVDTEARERALEKTLRGRLSDLVLDTLLVMNRKGRLGLFRELAEAYRLELEELEGWIEVSVSTAVPLTDSQRERLTETAARYAGRKPRLIEKVEPGLLGGMVVRIGDRKIDSSVKKELSRLSQRLVARASKEIHAGRFLLVEGD